MIKYPNPEDEGILLFDPVTVATLKLSIHV